MSKLCRRVLALALLNLAAGLPEAFAAPLRQAHQVLDLRPGAAASTPQFLTDVGGILYFSGDDGVNGRELWKTDGTAAGTVMVRDIAPGSASGNPKDLQVLNGKLYFAAGNSVSGTQLWTTDGTSAGTVMVKPITDGGGLVERLRAVGGRLFFKACDYTYACELWKSDGTAAGTGIVKDIRPGFVSSFPDKLTAVGTTLFFVANDGTNGEELWKSDGTAAGTVMVKNIDPRPLVSDYDGTGRAYPELLTNVSGTLFFMAYDGVHGKELWKSNGTTAGTVLVADLLPGSGQYQVWEMAAGNGRAYLSVSGSDDELWVSDGSAGGTYRLDLYPGIWGSNPRNVIQMGGTVYLQAILPGMGAELVRTDNTVAGTVPVVDLNPGTADSYPAKLINVGGSLLYFSATDGVQGSELWRSDGTAAGTTLVHDVNPGPTGSAIATIVVSGPRVFFVADDGVTGAELWATTWTPNTTPTADAGPDRFAAAGSPITIAGHGADADGDELSYEWTYQQHVIVGTTPTLTVTPAAGTQVYTLTVEDGRGGVASDSVTVTAGGASLEVTASSTENGSGLVLLDPPQTACEATPGTTLTCPYQFSLGQTVSLLASPGPDSTFAGWSGPCAGRGNPCSITLEAATTLVGATFLGPRNLHLGVSGTEGGMGLVGIEPPNAVCYSGPGGTTQYCNQSYRAGTVVTLTAMPNPDSIFLGWNGACIGQGTNPTCTVTMDAGMLDVVAGAMFLGPRNLHVGVGGTDGGMGVVTISPPETSCWSGPGGTTQYCNQSYRPGTVVTLTVMPGPDSIFMGWNGACIGQGTNPSCTVTMGAGMLDVVAGAMFLGPRNLHVGVGGTDGGMGQVSINPPLTYCWSGPGGTTQYCNQSYRPGTLVTLTASPGPDSIFLGWNGACIGQGANPSCTVTMDAGMLDVVAGAMFLGPRNLHVGVGGTDGGMGQVSINPPDTFCFSAPGGTTQYCHQSYRPGTVVTLTASPGPDSIFLGWNGACIGQGSNPSCNVTMDPAMPDVVAVAIFLGPRNLHVGVGGIDGGMGQVSINPPGTSCSATPDGNTQYCHQSYRAGTVVTLTATAAPDSIFFMWDGVCAGQGSAPTCSVTLDPATLDVATVARFRRPRVLTLGVTGLEGGTGSVNLNPPNRSCDTAMQNCTETYTAGATVTLTATPGPDSIFLGFNPPCESGPGSTCTLTMDTDRLVGAMFLGPRTLSVSVGANGGAEGSVGIDPPNHTCLAGQTCTESYRAGTGVTLHPLSGSVHSAFTGWMGACTGTGTCTITMPSTAGSSVAVSASFDFANQLPTSEAGGPYTGIRGQTIQFTGSADDADGDALTYSWSFGDGSIGVGASPTHVYASVGTFTATLTVSDGQGGSNSDSATVTISNQPPTAQAGGPYSGVRNAAITFSGVGSSDPDGDSLGYSWDFGDGAIGTGVSPTHAYGTTGTFTVALSVSDGHGGSNTATSTASIINRAPVARAGADQAIELPAAVILNGSTSSDPDGDVLSYEWRNGSGTLLGTGVSLTLTLPLGTHPLSLTVDDGHGGRHSDDVVVTVRDTTAPTAAITDPVDTTVFTGAPRTITWTASDNGALLRFDVSFSPDGGASWTAVAGCTNLTGTTRTCSWANPTATTQGRLRLHAEDASGNARDSDASITVVTPAITVTAPNTATNWGIGSTQAITWTHNLGAGSSVNIELSRDGGSTWTAIASNLANTTATTGSYNWVVAGAASTTARIRVTWAARTTVNDISNLNFTLAAAFITVTSPNTNVIWKPGTLQTITWNHNLGTAASVAIEVSRDAGSTWSLIVASVTNSGASTGSYSWTVTSPNTGKARIRVSWTSNTLVNDRSDVNFQIK